MKQLFYNFKRRKIEHIFRNFAMMFLLLFTWNIGINYNVYAQTTISTAGSFSNNNGSGTVTFNFENSNSDDVLITEIKGVTGTSGNVAVEFWYHPNPVNGTPGVISTANGWIQVESGSITGVGNTTTTTLQDFFTNLNFIVPANTTYGFAVYAAGQRYYTMSGNETFTDGGCSIHTGTNMSYGGGAPNGTAPTNHPRGWIGSITFELTTPCSGTPSAGTVADFGICPATPFNLTAVGSTVGAGIERKWQESPAGLNTWTDITGSNTSNYLIANGINDDTDYRFIITCTNSNLSDTSDVMEVTVNSATDCYCIPSATSGDYLNTIDIETDIDNHLYTTSSQPTNPIKGYDDQVNQVIETYEGDEVEVNTLYTGGSNTVKIWVDWNEDGVFDEVNELMDEGYVSSSTTVNELSFIVPNGVPAGDYRMRIRGRYSTTNFTPCSTETYGSAVDFTLRIITLSDCTDADAGTISSTVTEACSDEDFTLSASGMTGPGNGLTYQWQESPAGANTWTDIAGANSPNLTINGVSDDTDYRFVVACSFGNLEDTSNVVTVNASPATDCYCTPSTSGGTTYHITNFSTSGGAIDINNSSTGNSSGYEDYTNISVSTYAGATIDYTISTHNTTSTYGRAMWIDWNQDGIFDASEKVLSSTSYAAGPFTGDFTVPAGVQPGDYRLRVLVSWTPSNPNDPCLNSGNGEYEDYTVNIFTLSDCTDADAGTISSTVTEACSDEDFTLSASGMTGPGNGLTYQWQESPAGQNTWTDIAGANSSNVTINGVSDDTDYRLIVACSFGNLEDISNVVTVNASAATDCYCIPDPPTYSTLYWIDSVRTTGGITNITNLGTGYSTGGYEDYSNTHEVEVFPNTSFDLQVDSRNGSTNGIKVWIDWNQNGIFDANELVYESTSGTSSNVNTYNANIQVPANAIVGTTKMRIRNYNTSALEPCVQLSYGETEDYAVVVQALSDCTDADAGTISSTVTEACNDEDFTLSASGMTGPGNGLTYQWQESPAGQNTWTDIAGANYSNVTINGVSDDTDYRLVVACSFGNLEDTSNVVTVNASPATDCYCIPNATSGDYLNTIDIETDIDDYLYTASSQPTNPIKGYDDQVNQVIETYEGDEVQVNTLYTGGSNTVKIWVDWNEDGVFDEVNELMDEGYVSLATTVNELSFIVPNGVPAGDYRMRIRGRYSTTNFTPCSTETYGSAVDFTLRIITLSDCTDADAGTISSTSTNVCEDEDFTLSASGMTGPGNGLTYQWQESPAGQNTWTDIAGANSPNLTINGVSDDTDYRFVVACSFGNLEDESNVVTVNLKPANECYCIPPTPTYTDLYWIHSVETSNAYDDFSNVTAGYSTGGYGDFYNTHMVVVEEGGDFDLEVQSRNGAAPGIKVWIDWDQSGTFDANELVYESTAGSTSATNTYTTNIQVPANALTGTTRMRVRNYNSGTSLAPCNSMSYGETEDYAVKIGVCEDPDVDLGPDVTICEGESITLDAGNPGLDYEWSTNETTQTITVNSAGTYTVTVTDGACSTTESITVTVQALPVVDLGADTHICDGETLTLDAGNPGADYEWNDNSTGQTLDVTSGGTYSVTVTEGNCSASDEIVITELPAPSASGINTNNAFDCLFGFTVTNPQNVNEYIWDFGDGSPTETTTNANNSHNFANSGTYVVSVTLVNDCADDVVITQEITCDDGVSIDEMDNAKQLIVYPNPAKDLVTIEGGESVVMKHITVYNVVGQKVYDGKANTATVHTMDVAQLASGMYTVRIETQDGVMIKKFEVVK